MASTSIAPNDADLIASLEARDWTFAGSSAEQDAHSIHPFPAKFIPELPRTLLSLIPVMPGTAVLDPFAGSGTTLLEAQRAGHDFVGVDLNPIAALICRVKTAGTVLGAAEVACAISVAARDRFERKAYEVPPIPHLKHWFSNDVAAAMTCLTDAINAGGYTDALRDLLHLSLSAITIRVSNQESDTRYAALESSVRGSNVFALFERSAQMLTAKLSRSSSLFEQSRPRGLIACADSRTIGELALPPISLVITSPPYPNAYEYWLYNKYRMYWLGFDPISVRQREIGARPHYVSEKGHSAEDFANQVAAVFRGISKHLVRDAYAVIVVSSTCRIRGRVFDLPDILCGALAEAGYVSLGRVHRRIPRTRKTFNPAIGSIEAETIILLKWSGT